MKWHLVYFVQGFMHSLWWLQNLEIITCNSVLDPLAHAIISTLELVPRFIFLVQDRPFIYKQENVSNLGSIIRIVNWSNS